MPERLADRARPAGPTAPDAYVWHFVMHRAGQPPARGERLGTLVLSPADVAGYGLHVLVRDGAAELGPAAQLRHGLDVVTRALEAERREWVRKLNAAGYTDGWGVALVAERGFRRSLFGGLPELAASRLVTSGGHPA